MSKVSFTHSTRFAFFSKENPPEINFFEELFCYISALLYLKGFFSILLEYVILFKFSDILSTQEKFSHLQYKSAVHLYHVFENKTVLRCL